MSGLSLAPQGKSSVEWIFVEKKEYLAPGEERPRRPQECRVVCAREEARHHAYHLLFCGGAASRLHQGIFNILYLAGRKW